MSGLRQLYRYRTRLVNDMGTGFLQTEGTEDDWEQLVDDIAEILAGKTE